jgi:hypothetical protein
MSLIPAVVLYMNDDIRVNKPVLGGNNKNERIDYILKLVQKL